MSNVTDSSDSSTSASPRRRPKSGPSMIPSVSQSGSIKNSGSTSPVKPSSPRPSYYNTDYYPVALPSNIPKHCEEKIDIDHILVCETISRYGELVFVDRFDKVVFSTCALFAYKFPILAAGRRAMPRKVIVEDVRKWNDVYAGMPRHQGAMSFSVGRNKEKLLLHFSTIIPSVVYVTVQIGPHEFSVVLRVFDFAHGPSSAYKLQEFLKNSKKLIYLINKHILDKIPATYFLSDMKQSIIDDRTTKRIEYLYPGLFGT